MIPVNIRASLLCGVALNANIIPQMETAHPFQTKGLGHLGDTAAGHRPGGVDPANDLGRHEPVDLVN
jgi:hypothetical protein